MVYDKVSDLSTNELSELQWWDDVKPSRLRSRYFCEGSVRVLNLKKVLKNIKKNPRHMHGKPASGNEKQKHERQNLVNIVFFFL
jgi:hypothetical protein